MLITMNIIKMVKVIRDPNFKLQILNLKKFIQTKNGYDVRNVRTFVCLQVKLMSLMDQQKYINQLTLHKQTKQTILQRRKKKSEMDGCGK